MRIIDILHIFISEKTKENLRNKAKTFVLSEEKIDFMLISQKSKNK